MFSSINKKSGCCSKIFGCSDKKFICCPLFCCRNKTIFFRVELQGEKIKNATFIGERVENVERKRNANRSKTANRISGAPRLN